MFGDTGCCGYNFKEKGPNLFGLITFSIPAVILGYGIFVLIFPVSLLSRGLRKRREQILVIVRANLHLIHTFSFYPRIRCRLAGRIFPRLPRISGMIYRNFNLTVMILLWAGIIFSVILIVS